MLVLSRRPEEEIVFPELGISVKVIRTKGNEVRLGITAPNSVRILRGELTEKPIVNNAQKASCAVSIENLTMACAADK